MSASLDTTRWNPPTTKWMRGLIAMAVSTILSMPGCEQPTTITVPSGALMASESSRSSRVPGLSETSEIRWTPGTISVFLSINWKLAPGRGSEAHHCRRSTVVVALLRRQGGVLAIEGAGQVGAIDAEPLFG